MKIEIVNFQDPTEDGAVFFTALLECAEDAAIVIEGFRFFEGKIYPPTKPWKGKHYAAMICSERFCLRLQEALVAAGFEHPELEKDSYLSAKWGQSGLKRMFSNEARALEVWAKFKEKK